MKKNLIALAVAGLATSGAFAQSNVTIYGSVDAGYTYRWDAENHSGGTPSSRSSMDTGNSAGNRLGFKGVEDLGNGLKAVFVLEQGFNLDTGTLGQGGRMFGRQAYVGLTGNFGTAIGGRLYTPHYSFVSSIDPFAAGTVGMYRNVWGAGTGANALLDPVRVDNAVAYISPKFSGFDVTLAYSNASSTNDAITTEDPSDNAKNNTVYAALAKYAAGPVVVGLNVHRIAAGSTIANTTLKSLDNFTLGGTFDAKVVKIHALAAYSFWDTSASQGDATLSNYLIGASVPLGKATLKASIAYSDANGDRNNALKGQATQYAFGADYALSKRTNLYTAYSLIDAESARRNSVLGTSDASNSGLATTGNPFQQGFTMGIRHQF